MSNPFQPDQQQLQTQPVLNPQPQRPTHPTRGKRTNPGEIVEVQGGHIVRSTGLKDRHSKVCTAKGPRDRRVRLSAHTAIQFYDVQDRLGYDRPSKAVDWLMKNAKAAIDELAELPPWQPTATTMPVQTAPNAVQNQFGASSSYLPDSLHSDSIADTIKSFFPTNAGAAGTHQDLRLSLQSFQDPIYSNQANVSQQGNGSQNQIYSGFGSWSEYNVGGYGNGQQQFYEAAQRGPLQSSSSSSQPFVRAWVDNPMPDNQGYAVMHPSQVQSIGFASAGNRFSGFRIPARIQGEEEEHDHGVSDKPSSANSSD